MCSRVQADADHWHRESDRTADIATILRLHCKSTSQVLDKSVAVVESKVYARQYLFLVGRYFDTNIFYMHLDKFLLLEVGNFDLEIGLVGPFHRLAKQASQDLLESTTVSIEHGYGTRLPNVMTHLRAHVLFLCAFYTAEHSEFEHDLASFSLSL